MNPINNNPAPIGSERAVRLTVMKALNAKILLLKQQKQQYQEQQLHVNRLTDEEIAWLRSERELQFEWEHQQRFDERWKLNNNEEETEETEETRQYGGSLPEVPYSNQMPNQQLEMELQAAQALPFGAFMDSPQVWLYPGNGHDYHWNLWQPPIYNNYTNYVEYANINFTIFDENQVYFDNPGA